MNDADPTLMKKCASDLKRFSCGNKNRFEDVIECLRINYDQLGKISKFNLIFHFWDYLVPDCKAVIFDREKIEAVDNTFDDELQVKLNLNNANKL